jgi:hypothetical protein
LNESFDSPTQDVRNFQIVKEHKIKGHSFDQNLNLKQQHSREVGGARRDRTADLLRARQALSQLSYGP